MKTIIKTMLTLLLLLTATNANAQQAYAVLTLEDNYFYESEIEAYIYDGTLTFYYDNKKTSHYGEVVFDINPDDEYQAWGASRDPLPPNFTHNLKCRITKAVFDPSFAEARPTSTRNWFISDYDRLGMYNCYTIVDLSEIVGLQYLNTTNVTNMEGMFSYNNNLTSLDLSDFDTHNVTDMYNMFYNCSSLSTIYVGDGWNTSNVQDGSSMFADCVSLVGEQGTVYDQNHTDITYAHIDGGPSNPGYLTLGVKPYTVLKDNVLTFYYDSQKSARQAAGGLVTIIPDDFSRNWQTENITKVVLDPSFARVKPTTTRNWFNYFTSLTDIEGLENLNTSEVTNMGGMFYRCQSLTSLDLSSLDTHNVTDMGSMFSRCSELASIDMSGWDTSNVTDMHGMFQQCSALKNLDLSNFDTGKVTTMSSMFSSCHSLTSLDLRSFNTSHVEFMDNMFSTCIALKNLNLSSFSTRALGNTEFMFSGCRSLRILDLSSFFTPNLNYMRYMFSYCDVLKTIYVSPSWITKSTSETREMFLESPNLRGGQGTVFNPDHIDGTYAHIDGGPDNPGYFTDKTTIPTGIETAESEEETERFAPDGTRISTPRHGLNIIRKAGGSVMKVMVK